VPLRVAAAIDRALAKNPNDRWPTMADFCRELQECLREFRGGGAADATVVLPPPKRARRSRATRCIALPTLLVLAGLGVLAAALAIILNRSSSSPPPAAPPRTSPLKLSAVSSFSATGPEHPERVQYATDDNPNTYWETHHYYYPNGGLGKPGVGLVLDAGQPVRLKQLTVMTDTPGFTAEVEAGASEQGPFHAASAPQTVSGKTTFNLAQTTARFFVLWITNRGPNEQVHVNEINAS
jgi:hypothetical protein